MLSSWLTKKILTHLFPHAFTGKSHLRICSEISILLMKDLNYPFVITCMEMESGFRYGFFQPKSHLSEPFITYISLGSITDDGLLKLRGYPVNFTISENYSETNIKICGPGVFNDQSAKGAFNWRLRWLQTVVIDPINKDDAAAVYIYSVSITVNHDTNQVLLFHDSFSTGLR